MFSILLVLLVLLSLFCQRVNSVDANLASGFETITQENLNAAMTVIDGSVPVWLKGSLLKQRCGFVGYDSTGATFVIDHFMDCLGMCTATKFNQGSVTYTSRYYRTKAYQIYKEQQSNVGWFTKYATIDSTTYTTYRSYFLGNVTYQPTMDFWKIGLDFAATADNWRVVRLDPNSCAGDKYKTFIGDKRLRYPKASNFFHVDNAAISPTDFGGVLWTMTHTYQINFKNNEGSAYLTVYKIMPVVNARIRVLKAKFSDLPALGSCSTTAATSYTSAGGNVDDMIGYLHYVASTPRWLVAPLNSYVLDPCIAFYYTSSSNPVPQYLNSYVYQSTKALRFVIFRKSDSKHWKIDTDATGVFSTNYINAFEKDGYLYMDLLEYDSTGTGHEVWKTAYFFSNLASKANQKSPAVKRYRLNLASKSYDSSSTLTVSSYLSVEFPCINPVRRGRTYKYAYMTYLPYQTSSGILKLNVQDKSQKIWTAGTDLYPEGPTFVRFPISWSEDDGVLIVPGVDGSTSTSPLGVVWILNARKMIAMAILNTPGKANFGFGGRWYRSIELPIDKTVQQTANNMVTGIVFGVVFGLPFVTSVAILIAKTKALGSNII